MDEDLSSFLGKMVSDTFEVDINLEPGNNGRHSSKGKRTIEQVIEDMPEPVTYVKQEPKIAERIVVDWRPEYERRRRPTSARSMSKPKKTSNGCLASVVGMATFILGSSLAGVMGVIAIPVAAVLGICLFFVVILIGTKG